MRGISKLLLAVCMMFTVLPSFVLAEEETSFHIEAVEDHEQLQVTVKARHAADMYAYDFNLTFDSDRFQFVSGRSGMQGFSVAPIVNDDQLRFAHTQLGSTPGKNGSLTLAVLNFKRISSGESIIRLNEVKVVDSDLVKIDYRPAIEWQVDDYTGAGAVLTDIAGHWAEQSIRKAVELGFISGYEDRTFRPNQQVTRAEFITMLGRALTLRAAGDEAGAFADADQIPMWARPYVYAAVQAGLVDGYEDQTFRGNQRIARIQMAAIAVRALGEQLQPDAALSLHYSDYAQIPAWGQPYAAMATEAGIMQGRTNNRFAPNDYTSRAEAVIVILNVLGHEMR